MGSLGGEQTLVRASHLRQVGRSQEAIDLLMSDSSTPTNAQALASLCDAYLDLERNDEALEAAKSAIGQDPELLSPWLLQSYALIRLKQPQHALAPVLRALELDPNHPGVHARAADVYRLLAHLPVATNHANKSIELAPNSEMGWASLARIQLVQGEYPNVLSTSQRMLTLNPESTDAKKLMGIAQASLGGSYAAESFKTLSSVLRTDPSQKNVRRLLIDLSKPAGIDVPAPVIFIVALCGGAGFIAIAWSVMVVNRWFSLPGDVRTLVWSDRKARIRIVLSMLAATVIIAGFTVAIGFVLIEDLKTS